MIVITGGAGYIGSHIAQLLLTKGYSLAIIDQVSCPWYIQALLAHTSSIYIQSDYADTTVLAQLFSHTSIETVIHCAAVIDVSESISNPKNYYNTNVVKTIQLLDMMIAYGVKRCIFSSSCALYGIPQTLPLTEHHPQQPLSPYGRTKLIIEMILHDYAHAYDLDYIALRYFNAAGALPDYYLGERHVPERHLIPRALEAAYTARPFTIFGIDYATPDGSCIRDYIHVRDVADAHWRALEYLKNKPHSKPIKPIQRAFNIGTGTGFSVLDVVAMIEQVTQTTLQVRHAPRRPGDAPVLVANYTQAYKYLEWAPRYSDLLSLITSAHEFHLHQELTTIT